MWMGMFVEELRAVGKVAASSNGAFWCVSEVLVYWFYLGYAICSKYTTMILVHERVQYPRQNRFLPLLCDIFVLAKVLVIQSYLCMPMDDIPTPTSDVASVVHTAT